MTPRAALDQIAAAEGWVVLPYSGRWMYGRECCSFRLTNERQLVDALVRSCRAHDYDWYALAETYQLDALGLGVVVYWPDLAP